MNYYQFHIGDYTSHTRHLSPIEDIAYRRLLDLYYLHERPLNSGSASVARQINMREFEDEVKLILEEFFTLSDDGWINVRADKEIAHYRGKIEQASRAGKASAERRFNTCSTDVQLTNNHKPITNNQEPINNIVSTRGTRLPTDWELSEDQKQFCIKERPDLDPVKVSAGFKDYWIGAAGAKAVKKDWDATWRNWVRNQKAQLVVAAKPSGDWWMNDRRIK
jgi:uncharacterized protein YdaU (DUF1376 family)